MEADGIVYWANQYFHFNDYTSLEDLLDGEFFYALLTSANVEEEIEESEPKLSMGSLEWTLTILSQFYSDFDSIMQSSDYKEIVGNEIICTAGHVIMIMELVIGVLLK